MNIEQILNIVLKQILYKEKKNADSALRSVNLI